MDSTLLAVLASATTGALSGLLVPPVVRSVPEPPASLDAGDLEEPTKPRYADLAGRAGVAPTAAVVGALLGSCLALGLEWDPRLVGWAVAAPFLLALCFIDWHTRLLPNHWMWPLIWLTTLVVSGTVVATESLGSLGWVLAMAAGAWVFYFLLHVVNPSGIGFGDVRLSWVLGLLLAQSGPAVLLAGLWCGFALGGVGGVLLGGVRGSLKRKIPFGPFMVLGAVLGVLVGDWLLSGLAR